MSDVKRYDCTNGGSAHCYGCYQMSETELGDYVSAEDFDALLAERDALAKDWQSACLKKGFEYVRESDDHYVIADPSEMVALLRDLLGVDVRTKDGDDYGIAVSELQEHLDGLISTIYALEDETEALRKDAERYRWLRSIGQQQLTAAMHSGHQELDRFVDAALQGEQQ